jgi:integrase
VNQLEQNEATRDGNTTLKGLLDHYVRDNVLRPATVQVYGNVVLQMIKDCAGDRDDLALRLITHELLVSWRTQVLARARPSSWNNYRAHIRALLNYAVLAGWLSDSPLKRVKAAPVGALKGKALGQAELRRLLSLLRDDYGEECAVGNALCPRWFWRIAVKTLYYTGMRRRQLVSLRWRDINFEKAEILLRYEGSKTRRQWEIPIPEPLAPELRRLQSRTLEQRGLTDATTLLDDQVFNVTLFYKRYRGVRMTEAQLTGFFKRLTNAAGVQVSAHRMRHTLATELTRGENRDIKAVQDLLGHTDIRTTLLYVHTDTAQMRRLFEDLPAL